MCEQILKNTQDGLEMESTETLETQTISNTTNSSETVLGIAYLCCTPFICWNINPWCDDIRGRDLWEILRSWEWNPYRRFVSLFKKDPKSSLAFFRPHEQGRLVVCKQKDVLGTWPCWYSNLRRPASGLAEITCLLFYGTVWHWVIATVTDQDRWAEWLRAWMVL